VYRVRFSFYGWEAWACETSVRRLSCEGGFAASAET
jgi:hypothetical protein